MKRIAFFVEGATECFFIERLLNEVAGRNQIAIEMSSIQGGSSVPKRINQVKAASLSDETKFFALIYDCQGDHQVGSRILEEYRNLQSTGYSTIVGIRDVYPNFARSDTAKLEQGLQKYLPNKDLPVLLILGVMEIEAWFIAETTHFKRISHNLNDATVNESLGLNAATDDISSIEMAANALKAIYLTAGEDYAKPGLNTLAAIDFAEIYLNTSSRFPHLALLVEKLDDFFATS